MQLKEKHNFINDYTFKLKTVLLIGNRFFKNLIYPTQKFQIERKLIHEPVISFSESELWNTFDNKDNWILTAGKIENLRIASKKLHGLEIKENEIFSFWKHIGYPNFGQGYAIGREIREGCIVPTIAGGLCQLSNALYDAALKANFKIVERHKHTKVIKGSLAELDRDATVKWNYIDLRFTSTSNYRIEVYLTSDKLVVKFLSKNKDIMPIEDKFNKRNYSKLNDCYSCGNLACFKHPEKSLLNQNIATTTFILDEKWAEYDRYIKDIITPSDNFILPLKRNKWIKTERYLWSSINSKRTKTTDFQGILRAIKLRLAAKNLNNIFELTLKLDKKIAIASAKLIPLDCTHLVISQNLLPFIFQTGALGGRTYDVLMTRLPIEKLHQRLDFALTNYPESSTLKDFRAPQALIELENKALNQARKIITPHSEISELFKNKVVKLKWHIPSSPIKNMKGSKILFPASSVGRKGAYEIRMLAKELKLKLIISGETIENKNFWQEFDFEKFSGNYEQIGLIVYPTYIENQPRQILKAISKGIPIVTTTACGLEPSYKVEIVEINNFEQLKNKVSERLEILNSTKKY